jgi:hypothetical protein
MSLGMGMRVIEMDDRKITKASGGGDDCQRQVAANTKVPKL